jgi:hypothetical protein
VNQADANGVPATLGRFQAGVLGLGRIGGPHRKEGRIDLYRWEVSSRRDVEHLHDLISPWLGQVKLDQLAEALGVVPRRSNTSEHSDDWRAWAAGLYDGEGSLYLLDHRTHDGYQIPEMAVTQSSANGTPEVLSRFMAVTRAGHINGPYQQDGATLEVYRWKGVVRADVEAIVAMLWPWLGAVKRIQARNVLAVLQAQEPLPRGNPAWGNRKTHCVHGHEYATARMRPYYPRGVGIQRRDNKQCLECMREQARDRRDMKKRPAVDDDKRSLSEYAATYLLK